MYAWQTLLMVNCMVKLLSSYTERFMCLSLCVYAHEGESVLPPTATIAEA